MRIPSTWMKSITIVTVMPRRAASAVTASIWVLFPSIRTGPFPRVAGVAALRLVKRGGDDGGYVIGDRGGQPLAPRLRLPQLAALRLAGLRLLLPPFPRRRADDVLGGARGRGRRRRRQASSAIRLRPFFSPGDSRVAACPPRMPRPSAVAGRRAPGCITMPFPVEGQDQRPAVRRRLDHPLQAENASTCAAQRPASCFRLAVPDLARRSRG